MADQIKKLSAGHSIEVLDAIMTEVEEARGEHDNLGERLDEMSSNTPTPSTAAPAMDGTAAAGTSTDYARADHIHPSDTSKQDTLNAAQLAAVNSGINSEKVAQYDSTTELEAKDRAALVELVDGGAKNLWDFKNALYNGKSADASYIKTDTDITVTSNGAWSVVIYRVNGLITGQRYVWSVKISDYSVQSDTCRLRISSDAASQNPIATKTIEGNGNMNVEFVGRPELYFAYYINFSATSYQNTYKASENMICTKAAWDISQAYQPYRPSYQELYEMVKALQPTQ